MLSNTTSKVLHNAYSLKKYNNDYYKLVLFKGVVLPAGYEKEKRKQEKFTHDKKLENNLARTRSMVFEYAMCNTFDYFVTLTLNKNKHDRYDLNAFIKALGQFIRDQRKKTGNDIQYLLIPEKHKDGAYHMHGLLKGVPDDQIIPFTLQDKIPNKIKRLIKKGRIINNWIPYAEKFGHVTLEKVINTEAVSKYITKYIKKEIGSSVEEKNKKSFYVSRGLQKAEIIKKGTFPTELGNVLNFDFENEYLKILDLSELDYKKIINYLS